MSNQTFDTKAVCELIEIIKSELVDCKYCGINFLSNENDSHNLSISAENDIHNLSIGKELIDMCFHISINDALTKKLNKQKEEK